MAKHLVIIALFLLASVAACVASGFVLRPTSVAVVGTAKKDQYLWKPQRAISLSPTMGAVRISLSKDDCDDRAGECKYAIAYTTNSGESFLIDDRSEVSDFCGLAGVKKASADNTTVTLTCVATGVKVDASAVPEDTEGVKAGALIYGTKTFTFTEGSDKIIVKEATAESSPAVFNQPNAETYPDFSPATALYLGDTVATFDGPNGKNTIFCRNAEMTLANGTVIHGFYKSMDGGAVYDYVSALPFPMGTESALHVTGATKVMIIAGESNQFKQAVSVFLGSRWEKVENVTYSSPLSTFSSDLGTTIYGGLRGKPGLIGMAAGRKRGTEKLVDFANLHNKAVARMVKEDADGTVVAEAFKGVSVGNFSAEFINATEFECTAGGSIKDEDGCASSSYTAILPMGNGSTVFALYDKLQNGYNPATGTLDGEQTLFAMKLALNETKEQKEADDKIKEELAAEEKRKVAEEKRKQAQKEAEQRERAKKRAKNRANKAKIRKFRKQDKSAIAEAKKYASVTENYNTDDVVVIRDVDVDFIEQERDTFFDDFGPNAAKIAEEEAKAEAEFEEKQRLKKEKKSKNPDASSSVPDSESANADTEKESEEKKEE